jgi:hypothetical protein
MQSFEGEDGLYDASGVLEMVWNDYEKLPQDIAY